MGDYIKMVKTTISYNVLRVSEVADDDLGEGEAPTRYMLLTAIHHFFLACFSRSRKTPRGSLFCFLRLS